MFGSWTVGLRTRPIRGACSYIPLHRLSGLLKQLTVFAFIWKVFRCGEYLKQRKETVFWLCEPSRSAALKCGHHDHMWPPVISRVFMINKKGFVENLSPALSPILFLSSDYFRTIFTRVLCGSVLQAAILELHFFKDKYWNTCLLGSAAEERPVGFFSFSKPL
jgi:hypothetical protein